MRVPTSTEAEARQSLICHRDYVDPNGQATETIFELPTNQLELGRQNDVQSY